MVIDLETILTGDRPTGKLHLGHYVGSLKNRVILQNSGNYNIYVMIADMQALTDNAKNPKKIKDNILEVALDYLSVGIEPSKSTIFLQSAVPALSELTMYYMNLVTVSRAKRNPTIKTEMALRDFEGNVPMGFLAYPISQAADITAFEATLVPVGIDQAPILEQDREIVKTFNSIYGDTLVMPEMLTPKNDICKRLPGIDGKNKMSKSLNNCIYLSDDSKTVYSKVMSMFTDPNHLKVEDPGDTKNNAVFIYLEAFATDEHFKKYLPEYNNLKELKNHYEKGGLGDVKIKKFLYNVLEDILNPIREKRKYYEEHIDEVINMLKNGNIKANEKASQTLKKVRTSIGVEYFD